MTPIEVCNLALQESASRQTINSFNDNTPEAQTARLNYTPRIQGLLRAANWNFARRQVAGTVLKATVINGVASSDPPPQPFQFMYAFPSDALKVRFLIPYVTPTAAGTPLTTGEQANGPNLSPNTGIPFVVGNDGTPPRKVILTNLSQALIVYTSDLSQLPDMWDSLFLQAATSLLASYFTSALARNVPQMQQQIGAAKMALDQARGGNGNESISNVDRIPDWIAARAGLSAYYGNSGPANANYCAYDQLAFPSGLFY